MAMDKLRAQQQRRMRIWQGIGAGVVILIVGGLIFVFWQLVSGDLEIFTTPTPTATFTPTTVLPTSTIFLSPTPSDTPTPSLTPTRGGAITHVVEEGESLFYIADLYQVDINLLIEFNLLEGDENQDYRDGILNIGDEVLVPPPDFEIELPTETPIPENLRPGSIIEYIIQPGDLLGFIAEEFNTTIDAILEENDELEDPNNIPIGTVIRIPYNVITLTPVTPTATRPPTRTPTLAEGG